MRRRTRVTNRRQRDAIAVGRELECSDEVDRAGIQHSLPVMRHGGGLLIDGVGAEVRRVPAHPIGHLLEAGRPGIGGPRPIRLDLGGHVAVRVVDDDARGLGPPGRLVGAAFDRDQPPASDKRLSQLRLCFGLARRHLPVAAHAGDDEHRHRRRNLSGHEHLRCGQFIWPTLGRV